jgi:hypothetical protein
MNFIHLDGVAKVQGRLFDMNLVLNVLKVTMANPELCYLQELYHSLGGP